MQEAQHHGDRWFKEAAQQGETRETIELLKQATKTLGIPLGGTKRFTDGALTPDDEGELRFAITAQGGRVILAFGKQVEWIGLTPRIARELADALNKYANEA